GSMMREVHQKLVQDHGLSDEHFDAFIEDLVETLQELEIAPELIEEAVAVTSSVEHRNEVLNRSPFGQ
nr:hypothetical protein [Xenococcaceae cyanobacterium MO_207.B15]